MSAAEKLAEYMKSIRKVPVLRGEDALALASGCKKFIATGKANSDANIPYRGGVLKQGERFELLPDELYQYAAWIKLGAIAPADYYDAAALYSRQKAYIEFVLEPVAKRYNESLEEERRSELLILAAKAQLEQAELRLKKAQSASRVLSDELEIRVSEAPA